MKRKTVLSFITLLMLVPVTGAAITVEAVLCSGVENRQPIDTMTTFAPEVGKIYLWTRVSDVVEPTTIRHAWLYNGQEMADVELAVASSPWRTYSCKSILPEWVGSWEVKVVAADGNVLQTIPFVVGEVKTEPAATDTTKAAEPDSAGTGQ